MLSVDSELAATTAKLDAATARIASMEQELALLRAQNERMQALQPAEIKESRMSELEVG